MAKKKHKIFLIGGTGGLGEIFLNYSLEAGHEVVLYARSPEKIAIDNPKLKKVKGELHELEPMKKGIKGCDVAVITVGILIRKQNTMLSDGTKNLIQACKSAKCKKLLVVSSVGLGDTADQAKASFMKFVVPLFIKGSFADKALQEKIVTESGLDWTIIRPVSLINGERTGVYRHGKDKSLNQRISREDTADFLVKLLDETKYKREAICCSY